MRLACKFFEVEITHKALLKTECEVATALDFNLFVKQKTFKIYKESLDSKYGTLIQMALNQAPQVSDNLSTRSNSVQSCD